MRMVIEHSTNTLNLWTNNTHLFYDKILYCTITKTDSDRVLFTLNNPSIMTQLQSADNLEEQIQIILDGLQENGSNNKKANVEKLIKRFLSGTLPSNCSFIISPQGTFENLQNETENNTLESSLDRMFFADT